jgi:hypothetical protein
MSYLNIGGAQSGDTVNLGACNPGRLQSQHGPKVVIQLRYGRRHDGQARVSAREQRLKQRGSWVVFLAHRRCYVTLNAVCSDQKEKTAVTPLPAKRAEERKSQLSREKKICKAFRVFICDHVPSSTKYLVDRRNSFKLQHECIHCGTREPAAFS